MGASERESGTTAKIRREKKVKKEKKEKRAKERQGDKKDRKQQKGGGFEKHVLPIKFVRGPYISPF